MQIWIFYQSYIIGKRAFFHNIENYFGILMVITFFLYCYYVHMTLHFVYKDMLHYDEFVNMIKIERYLEILLNGFMTQKIYSFF